MNTNSKAVIRQMLEVENWQHTINGGTSPLYYQLEENEHSFTVTVHAPSIKVDNLHIEAARNKLRIFNTLSFVNEKGKLMMIPINFVAFEIPDNANQELIEAFEEADGTYVIQIPKGHLRIPKKIEIPIRQRK